MLSGDHSCASGRGDAQDVAGAFGPRLRCTRRKPGKATLTGASDSPAAGTQARWKLVLLALPWLGPMLGASQGCKTLFCARERAWISAVTNPGVTSGEGAICGGLLLLKSSRRVKEHLHRERER